MSSIAEVAKLAGVSNATISRVINHNRGVASATAANVRRVMDEIGYTPSPNRPGPKLGSRKSSLSLNILFLAFSSDSVPPSAGFQRLVAGIASQLEKTNSNLAVKFISNAKDVQSINLTQPKVDGILAHGSADPTEVPASLKQFPTVWLMGNAVRPAWGDQVMPDNHQIGVLAAEYLVQSGRRRIAYVNMLRGHWALESRAHSFCSVASGMGVDVEAIETADVPRQYYALGLHSVPVQKLSVAADQLVDDLLRRKPKLDGLFFAEDAQAAVLIPALQRRGLDLAPGGDLSVISCNNERPYLMGLNPCPPSIDIRIETIGSRGAAQLLWRIAEGNNGDRMRTAVEPNLSLSVSA